MESNEFRIIYLALLSAYEKNCHDIQQVEHTIEKAYAAKLDYELLENMNIRLMYLKEYEAAVEPLIKKVFKMWKKGGLQYEKEDEKVS